MDRLEGCRSRLGGRHRVYFISDRDGVANVWAYEPRRKGLPSSPSFTDFDVKALDSEPDAVVFEQAGYIHELDPRSGKEHIVNITASRRFPVDDAAMGRRFQLDDQHGLFAYRQAGGGRSAR